MTDSQETSLKVIALFDPYMAVDTYEFLCNDIILIDTDNDADTWKAIIKNELGIDVKVMPIEDLKFIDETPIEILEGIEAFIKRTNISEDINYFLDLVAKKGGVTWLSAKEVQRLHELSGNKLI